jgi:hypothetical protein
MVTIYFSWKEFVSIALSIIDQQKKIECQTYSATADLTIEQRLWRRNNENRGKKKDQFCKTVLTAKINFYFNDEMIILSKQTILSVLPDDSNPKKVIRTELAPAGIVRIF